MNLQRYQELRQKLNDEEPKLRKLCTVCLQPQFGCYCSHIQSFDSKISFVILIHPIEAKRRVATGRMSHLCLKDSHLIVGQNYSENEKVNELATDPEFHSVILYPGKQSVNLTSLTPPERYKIFPGNKKLRVFVIDGTWNTARKMMHQSQNINKLPMISFLPEKPSNFRIRKQPHENCYSTIEAIHQTIELIGEGQGFDIVSRTHDRLLYTFRSMVDQRIQFMNDSHKKLGVTSWRRDRRKTA